VSAPTFAETDWTQIVLLYRELMRLTPTPVVALNAAVATGMALGPENGLRALAALAGDPRSSDVLAEYHLWHAANADLRRRAGHAADALPWYRRAQALAPTAAERAYLARRVAECGGDPA
jgi:RNA polymerase sigma-70 factor (ECF subfamily)